VNTLGVGGLILGVLGGVFGFLIAVAIMRAAFSIGKIVRLLETVAQELRARNLVDGIEGRLDLKNEEVVKDLNDLRAATYVWEKGK
jgi:hypothetical protein